MSEPVSLEGTALHRFESSHLEEMLRIQVGLPVDYEASSARYPVVYLMDGAWYFAQVFESALAMATAEEITPVVVVGIGYEPESRERAAELKRVSELRCRDFTPTKDPSDWWRIAGASEPIVTKVETGHADEFAIVLGEIQSFVASRYRVIQTESVLAGFSLGALFALNVLFSNPTRFAGYICGSPSLWWNAGVMFEREKDYAARNSDLTADLFLSVGELEGTGAAASARMVENLRNLAGILTSRRYPRLRLHDRIFVADTHATSAGPAFAHGLKALLADATRARALGD